MPKKTITFTILVCLWTFDSVLAAVAYRDEGITLQVLAFFLWPWMFFFLIPIPAMLDSRFRTLYRFLLVTCVSQMVGISAGVVLLMANNG